MAERRNSALHALVILMVLYLLTVGGTFNGLVNGTIARTSLVLLTGGIAGWLILRWRRGWQWADVPLEKPMLAALIAVAISVFFNLDAGRRLSLGVWYWTFYLAIWLLLSDLIGHGMPVRWLLDGVLATNVLVVLVGFWQEQGWITHWIQVTGAGIGVPFIPARPGSLIGNPNALGTFLAVAIVLQVGRLTQARRWRSRIGWLILSAASLALLFVTLSRGAWLGLAAGLAAWVLFLIWGRGLLSIQAVRGWWRRHGLRWRLLVAGGGAAILLAGVALAPVAWNAMDQPGRSVSLRQAIWQAAWDAFMQQPLTGTGPFTFGGTLLIRQSTPPETPHSHTHNLPLQVATETGLPGLLVLGWTLVAVGLSIWRWMAAKPSKAALAEMGAVVAALVAFLTHHLTDVTSMMPSIAILGVGLLACVMARPAEQVPAEPVPAAARLYRLGVPLVWAGLLVTGWGSHLIQSDYLNAMLQAINGDWVAGADRLDGVIARDPMMPIYPAGQAMALTIAANQGDESVLPRAEAAWERAIGLEDRYAAWWANLAAVRWQRGDHPGAIEAMTAALECAPEAGTLWLNLGNYLELSGRAGEAAEAYLQALGFKPDWYEADFWDGSVVRRQARSAFAQEGGGSDRLALVVETLLAGDAENARRMLLDFPGLNHASPGERVTLAVLYEVAGEHEQADLWLDSAALSLQNTYDQEWLAVGKALFGLWRGGEDAEARLEAAQVALYGSARGYTFYSGQNLSWAQYLRDGLAEQLAPQLIDLPARPLAARLLDWGRDD